MELKRKEPVAVDLGECSFNRTFMELKPQYCCVCSYEAICFNRTFMELKQGSPHTEACAIAALIGPLWN